MTAANIVLYIALIGFMVYRRVQGRSIRSVKALLALPVILGIIGWQDLGHAHLNDIDITVSVLGCAISLVLGAARGFTDRISERDGLPWVQWSVASIGIFAVNIAAKLILDAGGVALGGTSKGVTSSLLLAVGLMLIGEGLVLLYRLQGSLPQPAAGSDAGLGAGNRDGGLRSGWLDAGWDRRDRDDRWDDRHDRRDDRRDRRRG